MLTTPPLTASLLFPYTTLFRSPQRGGDQPHPPRPPAPGAPRRVRALRRRAGRPPARRRRDRKSTRLNSSHGSNSYAVFCLKIKHDQRLATFIVAIGSSV